MKVKYVIVKETIRITLGCLLLSLIMILIYLLIGKFSSAVILGALVGSLIAILNFLALGISLQKTVTKSEENIKNMVRVSYSSRMIIMFILLAVCLYSGRFNSISLMLPLIFPRITIIIFNILPKKDKFGGEADR